MNKTVCVMKKLDLLESMEASVSVVYFGNKSWVSLKFSTIDQSTGHRVSSASECIYPNEVEDFLNVFINRENYHNLVSDERLRSDNNYATYEPALKKLRFRWYVEPTLYTTTLPKCHWVMSSHEFTLLQFWIRTLLPDVDSPLK